ncbi:MAG: leucine-rich repeat domain-containing protein [Verrucomicrobia bacterium]|nr:leucine-rich repeat domain-containing protein [Verrucomicrobiota bacterium]
MSVQDLITINYFDCLPLPLLGKVLRQTGELSRMTLVSRRFNKAAQTEARKIMTTLATFYGSFPLQCLMDSLPLIDKSMAAQVDALFRSAHTNQLMNKGQLSSPHALIPYHLSQMKESFDPYVRADDMMKLWEAIQKAAPPKLASKMQSIEFPEDPLIQAEKMGSLLKLYQEELESIEKLDLSNLGLHTLPKEIDLLVNLKTLDLSRNRLTDLPDEIGNLKKLTVLDLNKNRLTALPSGVCNLSSLESLTACCNRIAEIPQEIGDLVNLKTLFLGSNRIRTLPERMGDLDSLICLSIENNRLEKLPESIGGMKHLRALFLQDNRLSSIPKTIGKLADLFILSLAENRLSSVPKELQFLQQLEILMLSNNFITELPTEMGMLKSLQTLFVDRNRLESLPLEIKNLGSLKNFCFEGNLFESLPKELTNLSCWSSPVLDESSSAESLRDIYLKLGSSKWKECIDGEFHALGPEVFDKGLHGKHAEPGFVVGMRALFEFLSKNMNRRVDADFYLEMHKIACSHFTGEEGVTEVDSKKVGVFRTSEDMIDADFKEEEYPFTKEGIQEFNSLSKRLSSELGTMYALGKIAPLKGKKGRRILYHRMSASQVRTVFNFFMSEFYFEIGHADHRDKKLLAIARLIQRLEWLHAPCDGCGRTDTALLNYLLTCYGMHPVILSLPYRSSCRGLQEWVGILEEGLIAWEKETLS